MFAALNSFLTRLGRITDPYWANVSMLLHGDGTNAAQNNTFLDGSTNNFTVTRNGNTTQGSFNPFVSTYPYDVATNGGSGYFDGTGDGLTVPASVSLLLGTGDFTIECWSYGLSSALTGTLIGQNDGSGVAPSFQIRRNSTGTITASIYIATTQKQVTSSTATSLSTWYHVAFVRNGSTIRLYINGVQEDTFSVTGSVDVATGTVGVGRWGDNTSYFTGYVSNARMVIGTCLYPSGTTFTPPTAPLTAVTNTALLLGMSNGAIYDNTMLNNLETVGNSQISTSTFKYGTGALKFGGTSTDYMPTRKTSAFVLGSSDFTIECWVNFASATANGYFAGDYDGTSSFNFYMWANAGVMISTLSSAGNRNCTSSAGAIVVNTWYHIAFVRDGNTNRQYINGVQNGTVSVTGLTADTNANPMVIGNVGSAPIAPYFNGYIDDFRFTKGICRYPSGTTFTPPTAAFPNSGP
tara:strand:+ start:41 stop:1435 length:1395 start_codon:yes stop_codon:yes gene_type:complete